MMRKLVAKVLSVLPAPLMRQYRKFAWYRHYEHQPFPFSAVYIETSGACNRSCQYCAVSKLPKRTGRLSDETFASIIGQLRDIKFTGHVEYHFINEPLLDRRIYDFIKMTRASLPAATVNLVSNGDIIDSEKIFRLFNECGLSRMQLSAHDRDAYEKLSAICDGMPVDIKNNIYIKRMFRNQGEEAIKLHSFAGTVKQDKDKSNIDLVPETGCDLRIFTIDYQGKVHGCCADGLGDYIIGDVNNETIMEISSKSKHLIRGHFTGNFTNSACHRCVRGW